MLCSAKNTDIICLVETWLDGDIEDCELSTAGNYNIVRLDRTDTVVVWQYFSITHLHIMF